LALILFQQPATPADGAETEYRTGAALAAAGRPAEAIPHLERALVALPGNAAVQHLLAQAYCDLNRLTEAERLLQAVVAANPKDSQAWRMLAMLFYNNSFYDRALHALDQFDALQSGDADVQVYRASALAALGKKTQAEALYVRLLGDGSGSGNPSPELLLGYAQLLHESGRTALALARIDQAIKILPRNSKLYFWRARILWDGGDAEKAFEAAQTAIRLAPERSQPRSLLLKIAKSLGREEEAEAQAKWLDAADRRLAVR